MQVGATGLDHQKEIWNYFTKDATNYNSAILMIYWSWYL